MMNKYHIASLLLLIIGSILLAYGILQGQVSFGLAVFIPFMIGSGFYATLGFALVFLGIIFLYIGHIPRYYSDAEKTTDFSTNEKGEHQQKTAKSGGIILIGPIPIVFGSTKKMAISLLIIAVVFIILFWIIIPSLMTMP